MPHLSLPLKPLAAAASALLLAACGAAVSPEQAATQVSAASSAVTEDTRIVAALIYADWCGSCKVLDPKVEAVKAAGPIEGAAIVTLDYTAKDDAVFYAVAQAAGIEDGVRAALTGGVKTGQLLLIDVETQAVVATLRKDTTEAAIAQAISKAINAA